MVPSVVLCEKPSQAKRIRAVIGESYGRVLAARGHLLRLQKPEEVNPDWKNWTDAVLAPPGRLYEFVPDRTDGKGELLDAIGDALKGADRVIIATDTDREGQLIGDSTVRYFGFKGEVLRAWWKSEDEKAFRDAFANLRPNAEYRSLYESGLARVQVDQIFNLTLTRVATLRLRPDNWRSVIGIGRVKTPTLGIVCRRELEIRNFQPKDYFEVAVQVAADAGQVTLWHRPRGETRVLSSDRAEAIRHAAANWSGLIKVSSDRKKAAPPKPLDLTALQKLAGSWGWSAAKVLEVTQSLYETHTLVTYPRADTRYLPENIAGEAPELSRALGGIGAFASLAPAEPVIRNGKSGTYSNAGLNGAPHHAIIPNINVVDEFAARYAKLNADETKVFDAIARAWLAAVSPDHEFDEKIMEIAVPVDGNQIAFTVRGRVETKAGWKAVFSEAADPDDSAADDSEGKLPLFPDGSAASAVEATSHAKRTEPPQRYKEGDLPTLMKEAWKFIEDDTERERLKETDGIGTSATRATIVEGLKQQQQLVIEKGKIVPSELGLWLYTTIHGAVAGLVDPGATARLEARLGDVYRGSAKFNDVIDDVITMTGKYVSILSASAQTIEKPTIWRAPSPAMLKAAKDKAKRDGVKLPKEAATSYEACRAFLGPMREPGSGPSEKQIAFAQRLAAQAGVTIADDILGDAKRLSAWIDAENEKRGKTPASEKQMEYIRKHVNDGAKPPKGYPDSVTAADAKTFLDAAFAKKKSEPTKNARGSK